jgi:hypothetical protein
MESSPEECTAVAVRFGGCAAGYGVVAAPAANGAVNRNGCAGRRRAARRGGTTRSSAVDSAADGAREGERQGAVHGGHEPAVS